MLAACVAPARAHLCNDVFAQAKDNLAVKVDIRDGQLRIAQEASFRVYLLNTMDRGIESIKLEVRSNEFTGQVVSSPDWKGFPSLKAVKEGGKKEFFTVTLQRKPGIPDGKYKIELRLFNPADQRQFKSVDLESAADLVALPRANGIRIDGQPQPAEWQNAALCTDFYTYGSGRGGFAENLKADAQVRVRMLCDDGNLYCLLNFQGGDNAQADEAVMYVASTSADAPVAVTFNRLTGKVSVAKEGVAIEAAASPDKSAIECRIPRELLGANGAKAFRANFTRTLTTGQSKTVTYWRGNAFSVLDPIVYGQFRIAE
jgi:hypothetical protein